MVDDEHRHLGPVLAGVKHLAGGELGGVQAGHLRALEGGHGGGPVRLGHAHPEGGARVLEAHELVEELALLLLSAEARDRAHAGQRHRAPAAAVQAGDLELALHVLQVQQQQVAAGRHRHALEHGALVLGHHVRGGQSGQRVGAQRGQVPLRQLQRRHLVLRRVLIGEKPELAALIGNVVVLVFKMVHHLHHRPQRADVAAVEAGEGVEVEAVDRVAGLPDGDQQVRAVVGHLRSVEPLGVLGVLENNLILLLRGAQPVVVQLLLGGGVDLSSRAVLAALGGGGRRRGVPRVEEAGPARGPGHPRELTVLQPVDQVLPCGHVLDLDLKPIRSREGDPVCHFGPVLGEGVSLQGRGAVLPQGVHVQQHLRLCPILIFLFVEDKLILQTFLFQEKKSSHHI
mmetsp:Transcript_21458/g.33719  ORF Transcript_21458/g.33719 Transcript_21458/m.33719 type:complete len:399 (-) Transcript_21458:400-1596(-)